MIEDVYKKRRQIRSAWDQKKIPSKELIEGLLKKTLEIAPSKQNLFPFKVHVIEPDNTEDLHNIAGICALFKTGSVNDWEKNLNNESNNSDYTKSPWVLIFELRLCEPNVFVTNHSKRHDDWTRFNQILADEFRKDNNTKLASTEIGMYIELLTGLCLEKDLAISYIMSFPNWSWRDSKYVKDGNKTGYTWDKLPYITEAPIMVVQIGYKAPIKDPLETKIKSGHPYEENKPNFKTIIQFHPKRTD
tara:strand:- start:84 stop:821 length:738 start_codon:yes stop_codon:yes gene_type:complete